MASSAKAAELLQASGMNIPFIGLESNPLDLLNPGEKGGLEGKEELMPELRIAFKKLAKRDAQTREKVYDSLNKSLKNQSFRQSKRSSI